MLTNTPTDNPITSDVGAAPNRADGTTAAPAAGTHHHTTTAPGRQGRLAAHSGRASFRPATQGPMRRDHAISRFLRLTAKYRRA